MATDGLLLHNHHLITNANFFLFGYNGYAITRATNGPTDGPEIRDRAKADLRFGAIFGWFFPHLRGR
jgi:hypothetical protein